MIEREGRRRKVLANPLEQEEKFELLGVQHRGAPYACAFGLLAVRQGHGQQRRERVLHKRGDQEGRVKHGMRLDHRERAERVALDEHCHALGKGPRAKHLRIGHARRDGLRLRQKVDRFVLGQVVRRARVDFVRPLHPLVQRLMVRRLGRRLARVAPREAPLMAQEQLEALCRDDISPVGHQHE